MKQPASKFPTNTRFTLPTLALCLTPLIAMPAYAADAEPAKPAVPVAAARTITIDPATGHLRAPEADERTSAAAQSPTSRSAAGQSLLTSPDALRFRSQEMYSRTGAVGMRLDLSRSLRFSVVHQHPDGSLHKDCVVGDDGVHAHLTSAAPKRETNHE